MATDADVPEAVSIAKGEAVDRSLTIEQLERTGDRCSPVEMNKSKGDFDQHSEIHSEKPFADGENVQVEYSLKVESKNNSFGFSEGEHFLDPHLEISQADQSSQAGMEIPKSQVQLQKGTQVGGSVEQTCTAENEVTEERKEKFEKDIENHDTVNAAGIISEMAKTGDANLEVEEVEASTNETAADKNVQVISNPQDSIKENVQCIEKEAESSEVDIKGAKEEDGNAEPYHKEASDLLAATTFQEYEAPISTLDLTNNSFKKDTELETNTSDTNPTLQEEFEEETSTKLTSNEEDSRQTLQNYEPTEELQKMPEVVPEDAKIESATEIAVVSSTEEARTIQNTTEFVEKEEADPVHCPKENDTITEEVFEATSTEQETAEHALPEIQQVAEEVHTTNLKDSEKEADTKCEEPIEAADTTREVEFETIEQKSETNKDLYVPIPEEEAYAKESTQNSSVVSEVSEVTTKEIIEEDHPTVSDYGLVSGEVSQVSALKEAEAENEEHVNNTPEEKGLQTILTDETIVETEDHAQAEKIEKEIQTAKGKGEGGLKEIEEENKEHVDNAAIASEECAATILTDQPALQIEDIEFQAEENVDSKDKTEEQILTAADEGGNGLSEVQTENDQQVTDTHINSVEKNSSSEENLEKKIPVVADEGETCLKGAEEEKEQEALPPVSTDDTPLDIEVIDVQAEETFSPEEKLEELIPEVADECDTGLKEAEEENKEQVKVTDSAPEEKVAILTEERALDNEEIESQVEENVGSIDNLEKPIPTTAEEGDTEEDNNELVSTIDISPEECISSKDIEGESCEEDKEKVTYTDITHEEEVLNSQEKLEEKVPVVAEEGDTGLNEPEEDNKEQIKSEDTYTEEKGLPIISTYETALESEEVELQSEENVSSVDNLEKNIPPPADEAEHGLAEAEAEKEEQASFTDISPEIVSAQTILTSSEEIKLLAEEIMNSADCMEKQISTVADEGEDILMEAEAENKEQATLTDITPEEKGAATISTDERALETEETNVQAEESANSNENLEEKISAAPELGDTCVKEDEDEKKEQTKSGDGSQEEKGQDTEYTDVQAGKDFNSEDIVEKQIPPPVYEGETDLKEVEAEQKEQVETTEIAPENAEGIEVIDVQAGEINSKEVLEKQIQTASDEAETDLKEAEADIKEQVETTDIVPEQRYVETVSSDERALDLEDVDVQAQESFNSNENSTQTVDEVETDLNKGEAENKEQIKCTDIAAEEKDERAVDIQDGYVKAEEKPEEAGEGEGEEKAGILDDIPVNVYNTELVEEATEEQSYLAISHEKTEPKIAVEDEKTEDHPEKNQVIVEEVLDEPKITSRDVIEEQIIESNVASCTPESIEEETVKSSQENEKEEELKEEGSCRENTKEENASDLTQEYVPEDATEQIKDEDNDAVKSENEIVEDSQTVEVEESTTCETKNVERSEEILNTLAVKHDEVQQEEALKDDDSDIGVVTATETSAEVPSNDEEPEEEVTKLPDVKPEKTTPESSSETAEVTTCTREMIQESLDKENDTSLGEVLETATTEALPETHTVNDTAEMAREHQACIEEADLITEGEKEISEEQKTKGVSSSLIGEEATEEISKEEEEKTEEYVEFKDSIEVAKSEVLEDKTEQEPISEEESNKSLVEQGSCTESTKVILEDTQTVEVDKSTTCETKNVERSEEIFSTLPAKYDEVQQGEGSSPAPTAADVDNGAVTVAATSEKVPSIEEEDSPQVLQKYEPEEEITKMPEVKPEETTPELSSENAEVITCTKEEIQEPLEKENDTSSGEMLETTVTEALPETHTVEDTAERATEYQASIEAAELSTEGEKENSEDQTTREVSSSLIGGEATEEGSNGEEKNEVHVECKDSIEEEKSETLEDTTESKPALEEESKESLIEDKSYTSEALEKEIEKEIQGEYSSTVGSFDSEVMNDQTGLQEATTEDKELVETTHIAPEEKENDVTDVCDAVEPRFPVQTLEEEATPKLEVEDETDKSDDLPEKNNEICEEEVPDEPKITDRDINEEQSIEENVAILATEPVEEQKTVNDYQGEEKETEKLNEEGSSIENIKEGDANDSSTECVPEDNDEKLKECIEEAVESKDKIIEGNVTSYTPESIEDDTVKISRDSENDTIDSKEEESCAESIKEENASELSPEYIQENEGNGGDNFKDDNEDALMSEETILEDSQTVGVTESTTCETINVERSEETLSTLPVEYAEGSSPAPAEASKQEIIAEDTLPVQETNDNDGDDGAVTVTEATAEVASIDEDESPQVLQKYKTEEKLTILPDMPPKETEPEPSSENAEAVTCTKEETQESLEIEKDTKESDTSTGEACIEAAELSTEGETEEQTIEEVTSSLKGDETTEESLKEEEGKETHEECKEAIEGTEEGSDRALVEDGEVSEKVIEKETHWEYSSTTRSLDCDDVSYERGLTEATEQVETTHIAPETIEPSSQVQTLEETEEPKLEGEDETDKSDDRIEKSNQICEEVLDEPKITDKDLHEEQVTEGNAASCASESVEEEAVKDYQADEKDSENSNEEDSSTENIKEGNVNVVSTETIPEVIVEECTGEAVESKQEILQESQFSIKVTGDNDTVVLSGAGAEVTSTGEESSEVTQIVELEEKHAQVETSDVAEEIEVCDLEDKVSVAERTEEETKEVEVSNLALEKPDTDAPEEEAIESSEVVPETDSKSTDAVEQDEVIADSTLDECISKEPSTLLSEEKELNASEDEHAKEVEVPTEENGGNILAERSAEETCLPKEEPREQRVSELALEKLDAGVSEEETKEASETVGVVCEDEKELVASELVQETVDDDAPEEEIKDGPAVVPKFESESTNELVTEEIIADQTLPEGISIEQLPIPSIVLLPEEKGLEASEHETTNVDKNIEEENPKEVEVPADENKQELFATPTGTCLHTEEPSDTESALQKPDAGETEEEIKGNYETVTESDSQSLVVPSGDEIFADQILSEKITDAPISEESHWRAYELALEKLHAEDTEKIKEGAEIVPKCDSGIIEVVSCDATTIDQTFNEGIVKDQIQSPSSTLLPEEKEHENSDPEPETTAQDKNTEHECTKEVEVSADEDTQAPLVAKPVAEECLQKEEPSEFNVSEEANETYETVSGSDSLSITAEPKEEITADEACKGATDTPLELPSYTSLHEEKELKASELYLEKLDADTPQEETKEGSEVIPQSVSQSSCEVSKDEIIADELKIPASAPFPDDNKLKASEHGHETITDDKNIEEENLKEVREPTDEGTEDVFAARSVEETCLQKEEPSELKVPELAPEKIEADETEKVKETFETPPAVSKDDYSADQTLPAVISDLPLDIPSHTSLPRETEEIKEDATELAPEKLDADATEEVKIGSEVTPKSVLQSIDVAVRYEIIADQVLYEGITKEELLSQSSTKLPEEKELKDIEHEHGVATQDNDPEEEYVRETEVIADKDTKDIYMASSEEMTHLQKEEPKELKVSELSPEIVGEEEITATFESSDAVFKEETTAEQALPPQHDEQLQVASPTLLPSEKDEETVQKEELEDCKGLELSPKGEIEEETKEAYESVPEVSLQSIGELPTDEIVDQIPPSLISEEKRCEITTTINNAGEESMNVVEIPNDQSRKDTYPAEETSIPIEVPRELNESDLELPSSCEDKRNEASNEEKNIEVATSDSTAGDSCETTIEGNQTAKIALPIEEIKDEKEVAKDPQLIYVGEENIRDSQQENESRAQEKYPEEKNDTFIATSEYHHEVPEVDKTGSVSRDIETQVKPDDKSSTGPSNDNLVATETKEEVLPSNDTLVARKTKEEVFCESGTETADSTSAQTSLSERLMEESTKERMKVVTRLTEEKESSVGKEPHADEEEEEKHESVEEAKTDEEKDDAEHRRAYHGYDEPVIVEASGDTEAKVTPKKSHNILSGMGKSVKHSISKVKKAIIGKSSNSKTQSEK